MEILNQPTNTWYNQKMKSLNFIGANKPKEEEKRIEVIEQKEFEPFGKDGLSFSDLIDMINPLHHIPVINSIYRRISGDQIDAIPRIAGGSLFFGPIGLAGAAINVIVQRVTGKEINTHLTGFFQKENLDNAEHNDSSKEIAESSSTNVWNDNNLVTAWAKQENKYRRQLAIKQGLNANLQSTVNSFALNSMGSSDSTVTSWAKTKNFKGCFDQKQIDLFV